MITETQTTLIQVVSDVICPWCYVGKRRLEKALGRVKVPTRVQWRAFELNPATPAEGVDRESYLSRKYGLVRIQQMHEHLTQVAAAEGLTFHFDKARRIPNTFDAHRLIWHADPVGRQDEMVEALFQAYFVDGLDIGQRAVLVDIAAAHGLSAEHLFSSDEGRAEVRQDEERAYALGISGVPTFIVNGELVASGAQPADLLASAIQMRSVCSVDGGPC